MLRLNRLFKAYYYFFDTKLSDSSIVVGIIGLLIIGVGYFGGNHGYNIQNNFQSNVLEYDRISFTGNTNIIEVGGKKYKLILQEFND